MASLSSRKGHFTLPFVLFHSTNLNHLQIYKEGASGYGIHAPITSNAYNKTRFLQALLMHQHLRVYNFIL
jgi:hypothetical protein